MKANETGVTCVRKTVVTSTARIDSFHASGIYALRGSWEGWGIGRQEPIYQVERALDEIFA
jgi:hypothetical protein